ncbi:MAG TPA: PhoH family protein [Candidatus Omnitrophica bacterium]|nr:PhoH family protein [Candidatus Omnitrophota bacterium]
MERVLEFKDVRIAQILAGRFDENVKLIEKELGLDIIPRGNGFILRGEKERVEKAERLFNELATIIDKGAHLRKYDLNYALKLLKEKEGAIPEVYLDRIEVFSKRQYITPKTKGQKEYVDAIRNYDIVFGIGPAGTGKTYLAMAMAVNALKTQRVSRIILTRPAIEAGEKLGFLPGDMYDKVSPYLRPLYDALYDMMDPNMIEDYIEMGIIEVAPLAYMRGRTLNDAFIILDEAQNSTPEQMKMFLTRMGFDSKAVITGDITQSDLPIGTKSGLIQVIDILKGIEGIKFVYLSRDDVVRHELVQEILEAYERYESKRKEKDTKTSSEEPS